MRRNGFMETIAIKDIINQSNRKYTRDGSFEQLKNSITEYGILEPPIVRRQEGGCFRVSAGRRRIAAAAALGWEKVECIVREKDDPVDDEEIALVENVNRLEMHPLDEAAVFARMRGKGIEVEEIAEYYARSPQAIYKRLRLSGLTEELKGFFRDGVLNISGAAVLAELPEKDQAKFYEKNKEQAAEISFREVAEFVRQIQKNVVYGYMGEGCRDCKKRTHNEGGGLFDDEDWSLNDVCLDAECYRGKWHVLVEEAFKAAAEKYGPGLKTDSKIYFSSKFSNGVLPRLYKKADQVELLGARFTVLKDKEYRTGNEERKKKTKCCWEAKQGFNGIEVMRVAYSGKEEKPRGNAAAGKPAYGAEIRAVADEAGLDAGELERKVRKGKSEWELKGDIKKALKKRLFERALKEKPEVNYAEYFFNNNMYSINDSGDFNDQE
jgi:ParB/RepB/Spo0J family partition protein